MRLSVEHIAYSYENAQTIFSDVSFEMDSGQMLCLLGPNGCGKTTLLNCLAGLLPYKAGDAYIDGESLSKMPAPKRAQNVGYVPQVVTAAFDFSVLDYVVTGCAPYLKLLSRPKEEDYDRAMESLKRMGIAYLSDKSYARISGGERQLVSIARVIVQQPSFILLDEPTAHLDFGNQLRLLELVRGMADEGFGVLMTTHNPDQVLILDAEVVMMRRGGAYVTGSARDIVTEEAMRQLYGIDILIDESDQAGRSFCIARGL